MAKETSRAILRTQARAYCGDAHMDLLCDARANGFDGEAMAATDNTSFAAGAVSHRESLWIVRGDDARSLRNRIPGFRRWTKLPPLFVPLQSSEPHKRTAVLRS